MLSNFFFKLAFLKIFTYIFDIWSNLSFLFSKIGTELHFLNFSYFVLNFWTFIQVFDQFLAILPLQPISIDLSCRKWNTHTQYSPESYQNDVI